MTESEFLAGVSAYVAEYERLFSKPVSLNIVNRRWGVRCQRILGVTVRSLIEKHPELFSCQLGETGGLMVSHKKLSDLDQRVLSLMSEDTGISVDGLAGELRGSGYKMSDLMESLVTLLGRHQVIMTSDQLYYLAKS